MQNEAKAALLACRSCTLCLRVRRGGRAIDAGLHTRQACSCKLGCRDALAAAAILGRTVVLPQLWCWCDSDEHPHILERCRIRWGYRRGRAGGTRPCKEYLARGMRLAACRPAHAVQNL